MTDKELARRIRQARVEAGLSRELLAVKIGVSMSTLVSYETGRVKRMPLARLDRIAQVTGKPVLWFLDTKAAA